jgi:putative IMPACT (imprinted ancient) family translation regulator
MQELELKLPYAEEAQVRYLLADAQGKVLDIKYNELVTLLCHLPVQGVDHFEKRLGLNVIVAKD